jgi:hypothetical protein
VLEQVWFAGVHCDVGGGYADPSLSDIPFTWMVEKARGCGLAFTVGAVATKPSPLGPIGDSRTGIYTLQPPYDRRLAGDDGAAVDGGALAASAKYRYDEDARYRPPGLEQWLESGKRISPRTWR